MKKREKSARAWLLDTQRRSGHESEHRVVCAGLLAALRACESEIRHKVRVPEFYELARRIRDRILDAMEKANGGTL